MTDTITVMTWNLHGENNPSRETIEEQREFLEEHHHENSSSKENEPPSRDTDLFLLQAIDYTKKDENEDFSHFQQVKKHFEDRGFHTADNRDWNRQLHDLDVQPYHNITSPFKRCKITASRWPLKRKELDLRNNGNGKPRGLNYFYSSFLTGLFVSDIQLPNEDTTDKEGLEVWNTGIIHGAGWKEEKIKVLETVYSRIYLQNRKTNKKIILGGDFNAPWKETNEQGNVQIHPHSPDPKHLDKPFYGDPYRYQDGEGGTEQFSFSQRWRNAESYIFDAKKSDWDMKDTYWHADDSLELPSTDDHTHVVNNGNPPNKRLDHILADDHFTISSCEIQNGIGDDIDANGFENSVTPSDHAPVKATLQIE